MLKRTLPFVAVTAVVSLMGAGCNPLASVQEKVENKIGQSVANSIVNTASGGKVKMDGDDNSVSFTDNKTGGSMAFGENVKIPDDFPKDAPVYPDAKAVGVIMSHTGDKSASLTLKTSDDVKTVLAWYEDQLKDWKNDSSFTANNTEIRSYSKDEAQLSLTISPGDDDKGSTISVTYTYKEKEEESDATDTTGDE